jgi:hypothetical protein
VDEQGTIKPEIHSIVLSGGTQSGGSGGNTPNAVSTDTYSTTAAFRVSGDHFRGSGQNQPWPTVYLLDSNMANPAQLAVYACSQTELLVQPAPTGTTGTRYLKIVAGWDSDQFTVSEPLTAAT